MGKLCSWRFAQLVMAMLLVPLFGVVQVAASDANDPSPAKVWSAVIAHGVAPMPADSIAWRVVQDTAEPIGQAEFEARALGFAAATDDAVLITDQDTGYRDRIAPREALFTQDQVMQLRESLGSGATAYDRIALVPADSASDAGGDTLLFAGDAFDAPSGDRVLSLIKGNLYTDGPDDAFTAEPDTLALVLAVEGSVEVTTDGGEDVTLKAGEAGNFSGIVTVHSLVKTDAGSTYLAALIGPEMPAATGGESEPTAESGDTGTVTVEFSVGVCPPGDTLSGKQPGAAGITCLLPDGSNDDNDANRLAGVDVVMTNADTGNSATAQTDDQGYATFTDLRPGTYSATIDAANEPRSFCAGSDDGGQTRFDIGDIIQTAAGLPLEGGWQVHCVVDSTAPADSGDSGGDATVGFTFSVGSCQAGDTFSGKPPGAAGTSSCLLPGGDPDTDSGQLAGAEIVLTNLDSGDATTLTAGDDGYVTVDGLPAGTYQADITGVADQRSRCIVTAEGSDAETDIGEIVQSSAAIEAGWTAHCVVDTIAS